MSQSPGVAFIVGAGPRIGYAVAKAFNSKGYKVALGSRRPNRAEISKHGWLPVEMDISHQDSIKQGFETVSSQLGSPNVVVYNTAALCFADPEDPFTLSAGQYVADLEANLIGGYGCLVEAVASFKRLQGQGRDGGSGALPKVFIATGNVVPWQPVPTAMTLGSGKAALAHLVQVGNMSYYDTRGFRFYFASQVTDDGGPVPYEDVYADAHGRRYVELVDRADLGEWDVRFAS